MGSGSGWQGGDYRAARVHPLRPVGALQGSGPSSGVGRRTDAPPVEKCGGAGWIGSPLPRPGTTRTEWPPRGGTDPGRFAECVLF